MKVYLAGPISGVPNYKAKFAREREWWEDRGHIVLDPSKLPEGMDQADYMRICIAMIQTADSMQMLEGWEKSSGARMEKAYADKIGLQTFMP